MKDCLLIGMALGFIAGAILVQGNREAQNIVKQGKEAISKKINEVKESLQK
jgi:F0F1-type ATP synthase membrane subunit b/b'